MKVLLLTVSVALFFCVCACSSFRSEATGLLSYEKVQRETSSERSFPPLRFMVLSDPHAYDYETLTDGSPEAAHWLWGERKLLDLSTKTMDVVLSDVEREHPDFLLVTGDLTRDGERRSHELVAQRLDRLVDLGILVFVIPGNHDILNPNAAGFRQGKVQKVQQVDPANFAALYAKEGYKNAFSRDSESLSYAVQLPSGLRILAFDSCVYGADAGGKAPVTAGRIKQKTLAWAESILKDSAQKNVPVIAMMHHGLLEHVNGESRFFPRYMVKNAGELAKILAAWNVRFVFTGHLHVNDVAGKMYDKDDPGALAARGKAVFDIETGSTTTWPLPYRVCAFDTNGTLEIHTRNVTQIPDTRFQNDELQSYAKAVMLDGVKDFLGGELARFPVPLKEQATLIQRAKVLVTGFFEGDEKPTKENEIDWSVFGLLVKIGLSISSDLVEGLRHDTWPADNNLRIMPDNTAVSLPAMRPGN